MAAISPPKYCRPEVHCVDLLGLRPLRGLRPIRFVPGSAPPPRTARQVKGGAAPGTKREVWPWTSVFLGTAGSGSGLPAGSSSPHHFVRGEPSASGASLPLFSPLLPPRAGRGAGGVKEQHLPHRAQRRCLFLHPANTAAREPLPRGALVSEGVERAGPAERPRRGATSKGGVAERSEARVGIAAIRRAGTKKGDLLAALVRSQGEREPAEGSPRATSCLPSCRPFRRPSCTRGPLSRSPCRRTGPCNPTSWDSRPSLFRPA